MLTTYNLRRAPNTVHPAPRTLQQIRAPALSSLYLEPYSTPLTPALIAVIIDRYHTHW